MTTLVWTLELQSGLWRGVTPDSVSRLLKTGPGEVGWWLGEDEARAGVVRKYCGIFPWGWQWMAAVPYSVGRWWHCHALLWHGAWQGLRDSVTDSWHIGAVTAVNSVTAAGFTTLGKWRNINHILTTIHVQMYKCTGSRKFINHFWLCYFKNQMIWSTVFLLLHLHRGSY